VHGSSVSLEQACGRHHGAQSGLSKGKLDVAELGHAKEVSVKVAGGDEAARAALAFLVEVAARAQDARNHDMAVPDGSETVLPLPDAIQSVRKRARTCLECGRDFEVNPRHAESHRFHSAACRSRYRRRTGAPS